MSIFENDGAPAIIGADLSHPQESWRAFFRIAAMAWTDAVDSDSLRFRLKRPGSGTFAKKTQKKWEAGQRPARSR
jgi:hypothetical protein